MLEEAPVLRRDEGLYHVRRNVFIGHRDALALTDFTDQVAIPAENPERHLEADVAYRVGGLQAWLHIIISANDAGDGPDGANHGHPDEKQADTGQSSSSNVTWFRFFWRRIMHSYGRFQPNIPVFEGVC